METIINYSIGILGLILAVVGIYLTIRSNKKKEPVFSIRSNNVISDYSSKFRGLTVSYKRQKVASFTVSKVLIYNRGNDTIDRQDITPRSPLRIVGLEGSILDARVLQTNNDSSDFKVNLDRANDWITLDFEYLNMNHGAVIEVIHTGSSSADLAVLGDIKEVQRLLRIDPKKLISTTVQANDRKYIRNLVVIVLICWAFLYVGGDTLRESTNVFVEALVGLAGIVGTFLTLGLIAWGLGTFLSLFRENYAMPQGLESFDEK